MPPRLPHCLWRYALAYFLLLFLGLTTHATRLETTTPDLVNMDPAILDDLTRSLQNLTDHRLIPGATVLIARRGKLVYEKSVGYPRNDMIFRLLSMSKPITTAAILLLVQDGKLRLEEPVCTYIPQLSNLHVMVGDKPLPNFYQTVPAHSPITVHQLLTHTAGFAYGYTNTTVDELYRRDVLLPYVWKRETLEQFVTNLARVPLLFHPGTEVWYSLAYDVLGYLVERVSGMPFDCFLAERLFEPLAMVDTDFWVPPNKAHRLVDLVFMNGTSRPSATIPNTEFLGNGYLTNPLLKLGGQGIVTTARDFMSFCLMLYNGGTYPDGTGNTQRLLRADLVEKIFTDQIPQTNKPFVMNRVAHPNLTFAYGPQLQLVETPAAAKGEIVVGGLTNTKMLISRERELVVLSFCSKVPFPNYAAQVAREHAYSAQLDFSAKKGPGESVQEDPTQAGRSLWQMLPFFQNDNPFYLQNQAQARYRRLGAAAGRGEGKEENVAGLVHNLMRALIGEPDKMVKEEVEIAL